MPSSPSKSHFPFGRIKPCTSNGQWGRQWIGITLLGLLSISLMGCPATTPVRSIPHPDTQWIPTKWKDEPVVILSDSSHYTYQFENLGATVLSDHITWYWIQKRTPELLSPLSVLDFETIESAPQIEVKAVFPDGKTWGKGMGFHRMNVPDEGSVTSNRYVQWITMPRYEAGTFLRVRVKRSYQRPEFVPGEAFRQRFPVLDRVLSLSYPAKLALRTGIVNGESLSVSVATQLTVNTGQKTTTWKADSLESIDPRNTMSDPAAWYASVRFAWPMKTGQEATWENLGDQYLDMVQASMSVSQMISDFARELGEGPTDSLIARAFTSLGNRLRYHADEEKLHAFVPRSAEVIMKQGYGDCKEMSLLLHLILREKKIESYLTLLAIPRVAQAQPNFPSLGSFNHMILAIPNEKGDIRFFDPTMGRLPPFRSALQLTGRRAFILKRGQSHLTEISLGPIPQQEIQTQNTLKDAGGGRWSLEGTIQLSGIPAQMLFGQLQNLNAEENAKFLSQYLESAFGLKILRQKIRKQEPDQIVLEYAADYTEHYLRLEKGGFSLDAPALYGGRGSFTTLELEGPREIPSTRQFDEWNLPKGFVELESASIANAFATGSWKSSAGKIQRKFESQKGLWQRSNSDYRKFLSDRDNFHKATVWKR